MNVKGIACAFLIVAALVGSVILGARSNGNVNPVVNERFSTSSLLPSNKPTQTRQPQVMGADAVGFYGETLMSTPDANKRMELIRQLGTAASPDSKVGLREPQAMEILTAAYNRETDSRVKIEILKALSDFSVPEAAELLNRGLEDSDPAVRQAAQQAKQSRDWRKVFGR